MIYGLYHGLVYLPVMLSWFGPQSFSDTLHSADTRLAMNGLDPGPVKASGEPDAIKIDSPCFKVAAVYAVSTY